VSERVLIVDDDRSECELLDVALGRRGFEPTWRTSASAALDLIAVEDFDVVLTDLNMPGMSGVTLCERLAANRPDMPVVVVTAFGSFETAVAAMRAGAYDFITKPFDVEMVGLTLHRAVQQRTLREEVKRLRTLVAQSQRVDELLGDSEVMQRVHELIGEIADSEAPVLVTGETGTGKEVVARALHRCGRRRDRRLVAVNCAAIPEPLLESELFGHMRGAFTDAHAQHKGLFLQASGGTLFLDEIGTMPLELQPKLLRALEEGAVRPVGADREVPCDVRIVAATNRDLHAAVDDGTFRSDLFFRINVIHIELPPLRARGNDILVLAQHFLDRYATKASKRVTGLSATVAERLLSYPWAGNVRELQNCIQRAVALARHESLVVEDLPVRIRDYSSAHVIVASDNPTELAPLEEVERRYILRVLEAVGGNKSLAAQVLGLDRKTLYRKLDRYKA